MKRFVLLVLALLPLALLQDKLFAWFGGWLVWPVLLAYLVGVQLLVRQLTKP